jgi:hypothetical protein
MLQNILKSEQASLSFIVPGKSRTVLTSYLKSSFERLLCDIIYQYNNVLPQNIKSQFDIDDLNSITNIQGNQDNDIDALN